MQYHLALAGSTKIGRSYTFRQSINISAGFILDGRSRTGLTRGMNTLAQRERPASRQAGGAFLCSEAWQSGLLHRAYPSADVRASNPLITSREFEPHRFHHQSSGAVAVDAVTTPDHRPGDEPAATTVLDNIRLVLAPFHSPLGLVVPFDFGSGPF
jgi:hypothetical protein